jgi:hypothetical protein
MLSACDENPDSKGALKVLLEYLDALRTSWHPGDAQRCTIGGRRSAIELSS